MCYKKVFYFLQSPAYYPIIRFEEICPDLQKSRQIIVFLGLKRALANAIMPLYELGKELVALSKRYEDLPQC